MKSMFSRRLMSVFSAALLCASMATSARAADLNVRFAWYMPPHTPTSEQGNAIAKNIEAMSNGSIAVDTYPAGSLLKESNMAQGLSNGTANMGIMAMHWWSRFEPALEWDTVPFVVNDAGTLLKALHGKVGQDVNKLLNKHGVEIIGWGFYGYAKSYINTQHPIKTPSDLKGLKLRSEGKLSALFMRSVGAIPVAVDSSEVYTALQRGSLQGAASGMSTIVSRKWFEVGKYITAIHYVPLVYPVQVNLSWWKGLTQQQRDIISKAVAKTEGDAVASIEKEFKDDIALARKHGDNVYVPKGAELATWEKTAGSLDRKNYLKETGATGQQILDDVKAAMQN